MAAAASAPAPETRKSAAAPPSASLSDLLASLGSIKDQIKQAETPKTPSASEPKYCPALDWKKALALVQQMPADGPGVHTRKLAVSFRAPRAAQPEIQYAQLTSQQIDAGPAALDNVAVELEVREARSSSHNPTLFPDGIAEDDYAAYSVTVTGDATRTRVTIIVCLDTAASKLLDRVSPTDTLHVRGTARATRDPNALSIIVDNVQRVEA
jgi:hypothetical protein